MDFTEEFQGLPDIDEYLSKNSGKYPIEIPELHHYVECLISKFGINRDMAIKIVTLFFQEIRDAMMNGESIQLFGLGRFYISTPLNKARVYLRTKQIFPKFLSCRDFVSKLNRK